MSLGGYNETDRQVNGPPSVPNSIKFARIHCGARGTPIASGSRSASSEVFAERWR